MSRIDKALTRAGIKATSGAPASEAVFVSPWPTHDEHPAAESAHVAPPPEVSAPEPEAPNILSMPQRTGLQGFSTKWKEKLATGPTANAALVEQFRRLAGTLHQAQVSRGVRVVMVTSSSPEEGKTLTAVNLALVLSESFKRRVLLIDADLRRPSIGDMAELGDAVGLTEALKSPTEQKLAVIRVTERLTLLPAGRPDPDPLGGLTSDRMRRILDEAAARFDWVIMDAPPVGAIADTHLLAEMADTSLFVIRAGNTQCANVQKAVDGLGRDRILGIVLNGVDDLPADLY